MNSAFMDAQGAQRATLPYRRGAWEAFMFFTKVGGQICGVGYYKG